MLDYFIFYSLLSTGTIYILTGCLKHSNNHLQQYSFFDYDYDDPFDDSSVVDRFSQELNQIIIDPMKLLIIINKTNYPNFLKTHQNGLIYLIQIDKIDDPNLNRLLAESRQNYRRQHLDHFRWKSLKWIKLNEINFENLTPITHQICQIAQLKIFLSNQFQLHSKLLKYSTSDAIQIKNIRQKCHKLTQIKHQQTQLWEQFCDLQLKSFKNYHYHQVLSLYEYTHQSTDINQLLRSILTHTQISSHLSTLNLKLLMDVINIIILIENAPKYSQFSDQYLKLYRGLSFDPNLQIGDLTDIFQYQLNSTSIDFDIGANLFTPTTGCLFKLIISSDISCLSVSHLSKHSYESEFLLPPGCVFRIINKVTKYNQHLQINQIHYTATLQSYHSYLDDIQKIKNQIN